MVQCNNFSQSIMVFMIIPKNKKLIKIVIEEDDGRQEMMNSEVMWQPRTLVRIIDAFLLPYLTRKVNYQ